MLPLCHTCGQYHRGTCKSTDVADHTIAEQEQQLADLRPKAAAFDAISVYLGTTDPEEIVRRVKCSTSFQPTLMCVTCGTVSDSPVLDDDTTCRCNDIYEQVWCYVPCSDAERENCDNTHYCAWLRQQQAREEVEP
jgi:hypothetical protein